MTPDEKIVNILKSWAVDELCDSVGLDNDDTQELLWDIAYSITGEFGL